MDITRKLRTISGEEHLSSSYTSGFEYLSLNSSSPLTSAMGNMGVSNQLSLNRKHRDSLSSPLRFCIQTKDRFVVRVVKVTVKQFTNSEGCKSTQYDHLKSVWQDLVKRQSLQKVILDTAKENNASVYIGFQAQLPAVSAEYVFQSTSSEQINIPTDNQTFNQTNIGKGVRLTFSCPVIGSGLKVDDFYSGSVYQRLDSWEKSSGRSGLLNEILVALKKTVDLLLEQIQKNGLLTVMPEADYIFYPFTSQALFSQRTLPVTINTSTNADSWKVDSFVSSSPSGSLAPPPILPATSSPIAIPGARSRSAIPNSMMALTYQSPQCQRNPLIASLINSSRPLSAYGSCFDGSSASHLMERQISVSAGDSGSPVRYMSECSPFEAQILKDLTQTSTGTSSINSINQPDCIETSLSNYPYASASRSPSSTWWASRLGSPICATPEVTEPDPARSPQTTHQQQQHPQPPPPAIYLTSNNGNNTSNNINSSNNGVRSNRETPSFQLPVENDPMNVVINEVVDRLRRSPHLPLIVMPTQIPGTLPLVFQLPSADVIFVGLPACISPHGHERPRLVTSPAENSAFVVTSKRHAATPTGLLPSNASGDRVNGSRFTVTAPNPGSILGVSAEGDLYEFKPSNMHT